MSLDLCGCNFLFGKAWPDKRCAKQATLWLCMYLLGQTLGGGGLGEEGEGWPRTGVWTRPHQQQTPARHRHVKVHFWTSPKLFRLRSFLDLLSQSWLNAGSPMMGKHNTISGHCNHLKLNSPISDFILILSEWSDLSACSLRCCCYITRARISCVRCLYSLTEELVGQFFQTRVTFPPTLITSPTSICADLHNSWDLPDS